MHHATPNQLFMIKFNYIIQAPNIQIQTFAVSQQNTQGCRQQYTIYLSLLSLKVEVYSNMYTIGREACARSWPCPSCPQSHQNLQQLITSRPSPPASCACMKSDQNDFYTSLIGTLQSKLSNRSEQMSISHRGKECVVKVLSVHLLG